MNVHIFGFEFACLQIRRENLSLSFVETAKLCLTHFVKIFGDALHIHEQVLNRAHKIQK